MKRFRANATTFLVLLCLSVPLALAAYYGLLQTLWIPLTLALFLLVFPPFAVTGGKTMLQGLFDLELSPNDDPNRKHPWQGRYPWRLFIATLAAFAVAGEAYGTARWALLCGPQRITSGGHPLVFGGPFFCPAGGWLLGVPALLCAWTLSVVVVAIWVCAAQNLQRFKRRLLGRMICFALFALAIGFVVAWVALGLVHVRLIPAIAASFLFYVALGIYGYCFLGKRPTVPALASLMMVVMMLGWVGTAAELLLVRWHTPLLLLIALGAAVSAWIRGTDYTYSMVDRDPVPAPRPGPVLVANNRKCAIVVASAGGGIQAAAWTAQVLEGLSVLTEGVFDNALCLISAISGGSMGSACYVNWLANGKTGRPPSAAARSSSLDEVAWGLAWPDLWRLFLPWPCGKLMIDRAEAMERAWQGNVALPNCPPQLGIRLSAWNQQVTAGKLPALIMNSSMVEVGGPLLLGTSDVNGDTRRLSIGWEDGDRLHQEGHQKKDVSVVRAARLSASFPYVSPAARPDKANQQPHIIDGGFYDNYGMATLTEWLDQALTATKEVRQVLVIQINGFPSIPPAFPEKTNGGWVKQLVAPLSTLMHVRTVGQASHRDIELKMLQDKWQCHGITIQDVNFDFDPAGEGDQVPDPPLSWHLMPTQVAAIREMWENDKFIQITEAKQVVQKFLAECQGL
ncbi:MAG: patatin-like phospholipase family protein [Terracidiphilus sp.]|jgi:hypothetical protein